MAFPELIWSALVIIGGFLLIEDASHLSKQGTAGVLVIFTGFLFQVYWAVLHQTEAAPVTWNLVSQMGVVFMTVMVGILLLFVYPGPLRKGKRK